MAKSMSSSRGARSRESFLRRATRFLISPYILIPLILALVGGVGVLTYYYYRYTALIDAGLRGDTFVRSSGIYARPPELLPGSTFDINRVTAHLRRVGYVEGGTEPNSRRGQFVIKGSTVEVRPGADPANDSAPESRSLRLTFSKSGELVSINDLTSSEQLERSLEPDHLVGIELRRR
jgi:penicillin-binding protein 1B